MDTNTNNANDFDFVSAGAKCANAQRDVDAEKIKVGKAIKGRSYDDVHNVIKPAFIKGAMDAGFADTYCQDLWESTVRLCVALGFCTMPKSEKVDSVNKAEKRKAEKEAQIAAIEAGVKPGHIRAEAAVLAAKGTDADIEAASKKIKEAKKIEKAIADRAKSEITDAMKIEREKFNSAMQEARESCPMIAVYAELTRVLQSAIAKSKAPTAATPSARKKGAAKPALV